MRFEPDPGSRVQRPRQRLALRSDRGAHFDGGVDAGGTELLGRLRAVATVGGEHERVVRDQQHGGAAGETREIANIGKEGDEQRVDLGVGKVLAERCGTAGDVHRR